MRGKKKIVNALQVIRGNKCSVVIKREWREVWKEVFESQN